MQIESNALRPWPPLPPPPRPPLLLNSHLFIIHRLTAARRRRKFCPGNEAERGGANRKRGRLASACAAKGPNWGTSTLHVTKDRCSGRPTAGVSRVSVGLGPFMMIRGEKFRGVIAVYLLAKTHHFVSPLRLNSRGSLNEMQTYR